jgi:signal peptidase I
MLHKNIASIPQSRSMVPLIHPSDKVIVSYSKNIRVNDIVVFQEGGNLIAHRVIYIKNEGRYLITKGDNNYYCDKPVALTNVLGKVKVIIRGKEKLKINNIYLSQSVSYLEEIGKVIKIFQKVGLNYMVLKGFPIYLSLDDRLPKRLFIDIDLLVAKKDFKTAQMVISKSGFGILREKGESSQVTLVKYCDPYPVKIDLHQEATAGFTRSPKLNGIFLGKDRLSKYLINNYDTTVVNGINFRILKREFLLIFLLLHFFHHNFRGAHRMDLVVKLSHKNISTDKVVELIKKFKFQDMIFPAINMILRYYKSNSLALISKKITPTLYKRILTSLIINFLSPFSEGSKFKNRVYRLVFVIAFSPLPLMKKMNSIFSKDFVKAFVESLRYFAA